MKKTRLLVFAIVIAAPLVQAQGSFQNLDFEQAVLIPTGSGDLPFVLASGAILRWTAYLGDTPITAIAYNTVTIGSPMVSIHDSASPIFQPLQGNYSVGIQHSTGGQPSTAGIGRTEQLPPNALSLLFYAASYNRLQVTFAGNSIPFVELGSAPGYSILGGDISAYAGQTGELRFTHLGAPFLEVVRLDNIQFSTQPVPEPSTWAFMALGGALFGVHQLRRQRRRGTP